MLPETRRAYDEDRDIPRWLKWLLTSINRVGFPVVAFFAIWYNNSVSLRRMTEALERQSADLQMLVMTINSNHTESKEWRNQLMEDIRDLRGHVR